MMVMLTHETEGMAVNAKCQQCRPVGIRKNKKMCDGGNQVIAKIRQTAKIRSW